MLRLKVAAPHPASPLKPTPRQLPSQTRMGPDYVASVTLGAVALHGLVVPSANPKTRPPRVLQSQQRQRQKVRHLLVQATLPALTPQLKLGVN